MTSGNANGERPTLRIDIIEELLYSAAWELENRRSATGLSVDAGVKGPGAPGPHRRASRAHGARA
jgi:hypothetical protein